MTDGIGSAGTASPGSRVDPSPDLGMDPDLDPSYKTRLLIGREALERLAGSTVMVVGVGGVGGSCV